MKTLLNILWLMFGGLVLSILWCISGIMWCLTIIGIPIGMQCFKFASLMLSPFGRKVEYSSDTSSTILNLIWIILFGWELAVGSVLVGLLWCVTIIGIPVGTQCFKFATLSLMPFGTKIK